MRIQNLTIFLTVLFLAVFITTGCTQTPEDDEHDQNLKQQSSSIGQHEDRNDNQNDDKEDNERHDKDND